MNQKGLIYSLLLLCGMLLAACGSESQTEEQTSQTDMPDIVAIVNGEEISKDAFTDYVARVKKSYEAQGYNFQEDEEAEEMLKTIEEQAIDQLVSQTLLLQSAIESGFSATDEMIDMQVDQIISQFESEEKLQEALKQEGLTMDVLKEQVGQQIILDEYIADVTTTLSVTEEELQETFEQVKEMYGDEAPSYDEYKAELEQQILKQKADEHVAQVVESLKQSAEIDIYL